MRQYEAVILTLKRLGGQATLGQLYHEVPRIADCQWATRTPFASIRRIVQTRPEIFRVRPGLWALRSHKETLGLQADSEQRKQTAVTLQQSHSYYQGLLVIVGNLRGLSTFVPNQDKNKVFVDRQLGRLRTLDSIPAFTYDSLTRRAATIDVSWFDRRGLPHSFFEIEHATDIQNSLLKFNDLRVFNVRMVIVADGNRRREFQHKMQQDAFFSIKDKVGFLPYDLLVKQYERDVLKAEESYIL